MGKGTKTSKGSMTPVIEKDPEIGRVIQMRDHLVPYPELYMKVFISRPEEEFYFAPMFARAACYKADTPDEADLVVFTGGADVNPSLYGQKPHAKTTFDEERDNQDMELYAHCYLARIPMFGVCRGAQFLHVMNGGKLFQDVDGHVGDHSIYDVNEKVHIPTISSTHHQMVMKNKDMEILATTSQSNIRFFNDKDLERGKGVDIEAFFYRETGCLGIQGHPEFKDYGPFTVWALKQIENKIAHNANTVLENGMYRVKKSVEITDGKN